MRKFFAAMAGLLFLGFTGCTGNDIRVFIYSDVTLTSLTLSVDRGSESKVDETFTVPSLPASYTLEDGESGAGEKIIVTVSGISISDEITRSARLDFDPDRDVVLSMPLCDSCTGMTCPNEETCVRGACQSYKVDETALPEEGSDPSQSECSGAGGGGGTGGGGPVCTGQCFDNDCGTCPTTPRSEDRMNFNFSITSTEVTRAQYAAYLATSPAPSPAIEGCEGVSLAPNDSCTMMGPYCEVGCDNFPQTCVSWCAAAEYCRWAGLDMCAIQQWESACMGSADNQYPYGAPYDPQACNGSDKGIGMPEAVGNTLCSGSFDGLTEMSGNVAEWVMEVGGSSRRYYGGSYNSPEMQLDCPSYFDAGGDSTGRPDIGFRCCGGLQ